MSQMERLFFIDRTIRETGGVTVNQVAEQFEVTDRQVKRDIEYLRDRLDAPLEWQSAHRRYEYTDPWDKLAFADEKSFLAFSFIRAILSNYHYIPVISDHVLGILKDHITGVYADIADRVRYELPDMETIRGDTVYVLCQAMLHNRWVDIDYIDSKGLASSRGIVPLRLLNYSGKWYCVAQDGKNNELRTFSLGRILQIHESNRKIEEIIPDRVIENFLSSSYGIFKGTALGTATLRFYGGAARSIRDQSWHSEQVLREIDPQAPEAKRGPPPSVELILPVRDWTELLGRALRCGRNCEVVAPLEFRQKWVEEIKALLDLASG